MQRSEPTILILSLLLTWAPLQGVRAADWPTWGGDATRNMVNDEERGMPVDWDTATGKNILWSARTGSQTYGNPVIHGGRVFVGCNNEGRYDTEIDGDRGNVLCFRESDGTFLWQAVHDKLAAGRVNDWPRQGVCSTLAVEGDRAWYVNNRCQVVCVDVAGFHDGKNDGLQDEQYAGNEKADIIWSYDMIEELGVFPHNLATSSPVIAGDLVLLVTGNGVDEGHLNLPSPTSPSFIALDKRTGSLAWEFADVQRILHGQWSSPAYGSVDGTHQAVFPGGDGWLYALDARTGDLLWKFDCNPPDAVWKLGGAGTRNNLIATPVIYDNSVFIGVGQDPEHGAGIGHLYRIDARQRGDITQSGLMWHLGGDAFGRTMSTCAIRDDLLYAADLGGFFYCIDARDGSLLWQHDLEAAVWGSPMIVDGKVYIGDEDGDVLIVKHGKTFEKINELSFDSSIYTTPSPANGVLYIATRSHLYAIAAD